LQELLFPDEGALCVAVNHPRDSGLCPISRSQFVDSESIWGECAFAITPIDADLFRAVALGLNSLIGQVSLDFGVLSAG